MSSAFAFTIIACSAGTQLRHPGSFVFQNAKVGDAVPDASAILLPESHQSPFAVIRHASGEERRYDGPMVVSLDSRYFSSALASARAVSRSPLPAQESKEASRRGPVDRVVAYFLDSKEQEGAARRKSINETWKRNPIRPTFPPVVHVVETATLPTSINFEWEVKGAQVDPHKLYVWSEDRLAYVPSAVAYGGHAQFVFTNYGRYYWQVEDANAIFASAPRTIIIRPHDELIEQSRKKKSAGGTFSLWSPQKNSVIYACLKKHSVRIPIIFPHIDKSVVRYQVETQPKLPNSWKSPPIVASPNDTKFFSEIVVHDEADFMVRVIPSYGLGDFVTLPADRMAASDFSHVVVHNSCDLPTLAKRLFPSNSPADQGAITYYD